MRERILRQLSDLPWLVVAGALAAVLDAVFVATGLLRHTVWWAALVEVAAIYGGVVGFVSFRFGHGWLAPALGAAAGGAWGLFAAASGWATWAVAAQPAPWLGAALSAAAGGSIAALTARLVDPWLLRGALGRLASHHPRYRHLRPRSRSR